MTYQMRDKAHTIYRLKDGTRVPSVSTIAGVMDKPHLVRWANNLGLQGIDSSKYRDALASAGTLAHYLVGCDLVGEPVDSNYLNEFSPVDRGRAETSLVKYLEWRSLHEIKVKGMEEELISEEHRFGGRYDLLLDIDGTMTLVDIKTAKGLYGAGDDKWCSLAGYRILLRENGIVHQEAAILRIGRDPDEGFEFVKMPMPEVQEKRFLACREVYSCNSLLRRE